MIKSRINKYLIAIIASLINLGISFSLLLSNPNWNLSTFKIFGSSDQLSYLAIVKNFSQGEFELNEPFTETGKSFYPSFYYIAMGLIMRIMNFNPFQIWNLTGAITQFILVTIISITLIKLTKKTWIGLLGFVPMYFGVLAFFTEERWQIKLESHASIWGVFPTMFVMNAESFAISLSASAFLIFLLLNESRNRMKMNYVLPILFFLVGLLLNIHIYTFITVIYFISYSYAISILLKKEDLRKNILVLITLLILIFTLLSFNPFSFSPLLITLFGLSPAVFVILKEIKQYIFILKTAVLPLFIGASFGIFNFISGYLAQDPFLLYRQSSTNNLSVNLNSAIIGALILVVPLLYMIAYFYKNKNYTNLSLLVGFLISWIILSQNQIWGMNQEPYRFWIISFILVALITFPLIVMVINEKFKLKQLSSWVVILILSIPLLISTIDSYFFYKSSTARGIYYYEVPQNKALIKASRKLDEGLIALDACLDPSLYKVLTGRTVAYFNEGMAWPTDYENIAKLNKQLESSEVTINDLKFNKIEYFLIDSNCENAGIYNQYFSTIKKESIEYESGVITVFKINSK